MTIREIAAECGVSTATVDRVLNGRGKVRPDTEARILTALRKAGYSKNIAARALAIQKAAPVVGLVLSSVGNPFFEEVLRGVDQAREELADYGITLRVSQMRGYDPGQQLALITGMQEEISVLVLHPIDHPGIVQKVAELADRGVPTITVNTDLEGSRRRCYVGSDYEKGGRTAAGVMSLAIQGEARLGILTGVETLLGHRQRLHGFESGLMESGCPIRIVARASAKDDDDSAYAATKAMLLADPSIDTLLLVAAGLKGLCDALFDLKLEERVRLFAFDNIAMTRPMLACGLLKAVVCQQPFQQGYLALRAARDIILSGGLTYDRRIMENQIRILENLED